MIFVEGFRRIVHHIPALHQSILFARQKPRRAPPIILAFEWTLLCAHSRPLKREKSDCGLLVAASPVCFCGLIMPHRPRLRGLWSRFNLVISKPSRNGRTERPEFYLCLQPFDYLQSEEPPHSIDSKAGEFLMAIEAYSRLAGGPQTDTQGPNLFQVYGEQMCAKDCPGPRG